MNQWPPAIQQNVGQIDIWLSRADCGQGESILDDWRSLLNDSEATRYRRFVFERDRLRFLVTRALVREVLTVYEPSVQPVDWSFNHNEFGKPFIANKELTRQLYFNVSHARRWIVMAVSCRRSLGVDVETTDREGRFLDVANRFFSPLEVRELFELPTSLQCARFFDLWTLKEAYIKARGGGLSIPLSEFSFSFPNENEISLSLAEDSEDTTSGWNFWHFRLDENHKLALAIKAVQADPFTQIEIRRTVPGRTYQTITLPLLRSMHLPVRDAVIC